MPVTIPRIYLNNAGRGVSHPRMRARLRKFMSREDQVGTVGAEREVQDELQDVHAKAAELIGAQPGELALTTTTSAAWFAAIACLPMRGSRVLLAPSEWASNIESLRRDPRLAGATLEVMPIDASGAIDIAQLAARIDEDVALICAPMIASVSGRRYPVEAIGALPRPDHTLYVVDAAQALAQIPVSVRELNCDALAAPARKWLRGPSGVAFQYCSTRALERMNANPGPNLCGLEWHETSRTFRDRADARRFDSFDPPVMPRLALGAAIDAHRESCANIRRELDELAQHTRDVARSKGVELLTPALESAITTLRLPGIDTQRLEQALDASGIAAKVAQPHSEPLDGSLPSDEVLLRVSAHVTNTKTELDALFDDVIGRL